MIFYHILDKEQLHTPHVASALQIEILKQVFTHWVRYDRPLPVKLLDLVIPPEDVLEELKLMEISDLIIRRQESIEITEAGRSKFSVVLTGGAYDLVHKGHLITLKEAKSKGDFLVVVVARDITVNRRKREPIHSEKDRMYLLNELEVVDAAILGDQVDHMRVVRRIKPDVVALGADQDHIKEVLEAQIIDQGLRHTEIVRLEADYEGLATTQLIEEILSRKWN